MSHWMQEAEKLLSDLISDEKAESLLDESLYETGDSSASYSFDRKLTLKGIELDLRRQQYPSMEILLRDVRALLSNATQIFKQAPHIVELAETVTQFERERESRNDDEASTHTRTRRRSARIAKLKYDPVASPIASTQPKTTKKRKYSDLQQPRNANPNAEVDGDGHGDADDSDVLSSPNKKPRLSSADTLPVTPTPPRTLSTSLSEPSKKRPRRVRRKKRTSSENVNVNMHDHDNEDNEQDGNEDDDDDVEMVPRSEPPTEIERRTSRSPPQHAQPQQPQSDPEIGYNLRNRVRSKYKLTSSPSKSKTPNLSTPPPNSSNVHQEKEKKEKEKEESVHSVQSSSIEIDFEDGTQDMMEGGFDGEQKMRYSCRGLCINGEYKSFNQDWISLDRFDQFKDEHAVICTGVYDGHGILGHIASKYCARHIPKEFMFELFELHKQQNNDNGDGSSSEHGKQHALQQAVTAALHTIDTQLKEIAQCESTMFSTILQRNGCASRLIDYGTTVNCLVSDGTDAYVVNVGDSRCLLIQGCMAPNGKWTLTHSQVTADHNAMSRPDEQERVCQDGGKFFRLNNELRLYPKDRPFKEARRQGLAINMTRAVGHSTLSKYGLIAQPETHHIAIQPEHEYIFVAASDGLWDVVDNTQVFNVVQSIYNTFIHNQTNETIEDEIVMELTQCAQKKWRKKRIGDNISIVVTRIFNKL